VLRRFDPVTAPDETLNWMYDLRRAAHHEAAPDEPFESRDRFYGRLRHPLPSAQRYMWVIGGVGFASLDLDDDSPTGFVRIFVEPAHRRRGSGRELLDAIIHQARSVGCPELTSQFGTEGGAAFAAAVGARPSFASIRSRLGLPAALAPVDVPGFTVRSWCGPTPDELLETYAEARQAIGDAPFDGGIDGSAWTPQRVRAEEQAVAARGVDIYATAVLEGPRAVATTELRVGRQPGADATTEDTSVVRDRRGRGLARLVKVSSLLALAAARPDVTQILTSNHESNAAMLAVNRSLGFVEVGRWTSAYVTL
jgi:GNAT superfamily N-acetyltransferase